MSQTTTYQGEDIAALLNEADPRYYEVARSSDGAQTLSLRFEDFKWVRNSELYLSFMAIGAITTAQRPGRRAVMDSVSDATTQVMGASRVQIKDGVFPLEVRNISRVSRRDICLTMKEPDGFVITVRKTAECTDEFARSLTEFPVFELPLRPFLSSQSATPAATSSSQAGTIPIIEVSEEETIVVEIQTTSRTQTNDSETTPRRSSNSSNVRQNRRRAAGPRRTIVPSRPESRRLADIEAYIANERELAGERNRRIKAYLESQKRQAENECSAINDLIRRIDRHQ